MDKQKITQKYFVMEVKMKTDIEQYIFIINEHV